MELVDIVLTFTFCLFTLSSFLCLDLFSFGYGQGEHAVLQACLGFVCLKSGRETQTAGKGTIATFSKKVVFFLDFLSQ